MIFSLAATAIFVPGYFRVGDLHVPVYGVFAALGLIAALWLSQRTAALAGLNPDALWDAGVFAAIAAFVVSRLLLVAVELKAFLQYPLLVLALPSLTYGGMVLTGLLVWGWLKWKRIPITDALDAWAVPATLLAAVLAIAHFVEGTDAGMPTRLPWGVTTPGDSVLGRVHPVQIYAAIAAIALGVGLFRKLPRRKFSGQIAALALMIGGTLSFLLTMLQQPMDTVSDLPLDPGQFVALAAMLAGAFLYAQSPAHGATSINQKQEAARPQVQSGATLEEAQ